LPVDLASTLADIAVPDTVSGAKHDHDSANNKGFPDDIEEEMHGLSTCNKYVPRGGESVQRIVSPRRAT
jgi:hypothetical protein